VCGLLRYQRRLFWTSYQPGFVIAWVKGLLTCGTYNVVHSTIPVNLVLSNYIPDIPLKPGHTNMAPIKAISTIQWSGISRQASLYLGSQVQKKRHMQA
jgi:hypothetical protein